MFRVHCTSFNFLELVQWTRNSLKGDLIKSARLLARKMAGTGFEPMTSRL